MSFEWMGYAAAFCTATSFIPQAIHTLKTRDTRAISLGMYIIFNMGIMFWLGYGLAIADTAIILANSVTGLFSLTVLYHKVKNDWAAKAALRVEAQVTQPAPTKRG